MKRRDYEMTALDYLCLSILWTVAGVGFFVGMFLWVTEDML